MMDQKLGEVRVTKTGVLETRAKAQHGPFDNEL